MKRHQWIIWTAALMVACGDEEVVAPQDRCDADGLAVFATGEIVTEQGTFKVSASLPAADGEIAGQEMTLALGTVKRESDTPTLLFKLRENGQTNDLLDNLANASADGPATLTFVDASQPPVDAVRRTDLSVFSCAMAQGTTCGQVALDTADPGVVSDADDKVYNLVGGTFTVEGVENATARVNFKFDAQLGRNVLKTGDTSTGRIQGCIRAKYASSSAMGWTLN